MEPILHLPADVTLGETRENLEESRPISRSPNPAGNRDGPESTHAITPPHRGDHTPYSPVIPFLPPSQYSYNLSSQDSGNCPPALSSKDRLRPTIGIDRIDKHKAIVVDNVTHPHVAPPVTTQFVRDSTPDNWIPLMHPEGALYWVHENEPIYTDTNMCDLALRQKIEEVVREINELKRVSPPLPEDWELALELGEDDETGEPICSYYFVCLSTRCLFWLHEFDLESVLGGLHGVTEKTHIHLALQAHYWSHWEMFPHNREVPEDLIQELTGILLHAGIDCTTSPNSTAIYSEPELKNLLSYVKEIKEVGGNHGFSACVVGRLMNFLTFSRYINFYGQKGARLTNDQTIYGFQPKRTYLIKILSVFFFYAPDLHLRGLESIYTDFVIYRHRWMQFITRLQSDWTELILYGVLLLNANVAFLAIPSVDPGNHTRTPAQLASYLSIITSIGNVVIGLLLLRQHSTKPQITTAEIDYYLRARHHNAFGFETLAILYSLPHSLLLWAIIAFTVAVGLEAILFSSELWAKLPAGIILAVIILLISWCALATLKAETNFCVLDRVHALKGGLVNFTRGLRGKALSPSQKPEMLEVKMVRA